MVLYKRSGLPPNLYELLQVPCTASSADIQRSFRNLSMSFHPDKNKSPEAHELFLQLSQAKDILLSPLRQRYDMFGFSAVRHVISKASDATSEMQLLSFAIIQTISFDLVWILIILMMMHGPGANQSRLWAFAGLVITNLVELEYRINPQYDIFSNSLFPFWTRFEKAVFLRSIFPTFYSACQLISRVFKNHAATVIDVNIVNITSIVTNIIEKLSLLQIESILALQSVHQNVNVELTSTKAELKKLLEARKESNLSTSTEVITQNEDVDTQSHQDIDGIDTERYDIDTYSTRTTGTTEDEDEDNNEQSEGDDLKSTDTSDAVHKLEANAKKLFVEIEEGLRTTKKLIHLTFGLIKEDSTTNPLLDLVLMFGIPALINFVLSGSVSND